jgi:transposase
MQKKACQVVSRKIKQQKSLKKSHKTIQNVRKAYQKCQNMQKKACQVVSRKIKEQKSLKVTLKIDVKKVY